MIVVTGASGHVGGLTAQALAARGVPMRLLVRDPARAPELPGAEVVAADYRDADSLARALGEGDRVFMVSMHAFPKQRIALHRSFIEAAARQGVAHVTYLSFINPSPDATFVHATSHAATEEMLRQSGLPFSAIRNGMYADEIPGWFDSEGVCRYPVGDGRLTFSYRPELAEAIAVTLTDEAMAEASSTSRRPTRSSMAELAEIASQVTGKTYRYEPPDRDAWRAERLARGRDEEEIDATLSSFDAQRLGELDLVSDDFRALTGRDPLTVDEVIERLLDRCLSGRAATPRCPARADALPVLFLSAQPGLLTP